LNNSEKSFTGITDIINESKRKDLLEETVLLKQKIEEIQEDIKTRKEEEIIKFKKKFEFLKGPNSTYSSHIKYELCYCCLFGNNVDI